MNKGLELIEAMHLFSVPAEMIEIVVQRESVIHSMVEFCDHSVIAQLSVPDMTLACEYAILYPDRGQAVIEELDFFKLGKLTFARPDEETFRCLKIARNAAARGGNLPAAVNGANEAAVSLFLEGKISFDKIRT